MKEKEDEFWHISDSSSHELPREQQKTLCGKSSYYQKVEMLAHARMLKYTGKTKTMYHPEKYCNKCFELLKV